MWKQIAVDLAKLLKEKRCPACEQKFGSVNKQPELECVCAHERETLKRFDHSWWSINQAGRPDEGRIE